MLSRQLLFLSALLGAAHGAGMNTHTQVGYRAAKWFGKVGDASSNASAYNAAIAANVEAVHGGSDFPDFLYACGTYSDHSDAGEAAHWPPFQAAAIKYIRALPDFLPDPATGAATWSDNTTKVRCLPRVAA